MTLALTPDLAARFADIALGHVAREYPNKLDHVLDGEADARGPRVLHPIFYGSFDWHSCVHSYWMLARLLRRFPDAPFAYRIIERFDAAFTDEAVAGELAYLQRPSSGGFERPYGWAWLLKLAAELRTEPFPLEGGRAGMGVNPPELVEERTRRRRLINSLPNVGAHTPSQPPPSRGRGSRPRWSIALQSLAEVFADRFRAFLPKADYPVRAGAHTNTAFALRLAFDYAEALGDDELAATIRERGRLWYGEDHAAPAWEPSGDDFLSPTLVEAQLMAAILAPDAFAAWFQPFLPEIGAERPATLFEPVRVSDRGDGKIAHLDGLNLSRAWAWRELAPHLNPDAAAQARASAERHLSASLPHVAGDYMGEHWLATYAVLALDAPA